MRLEPWAVNHYMVPMSRRYSAGDYQSGAAFAILGIGPATIDAWRA